MADADEALAARSDYACGRASREGDAMSAIETLRAILVAGAVVAAVVATTYGRWITAAVLLGAVAVHGYTTLYLRRLRLARTARSSPPASGA